MSQISYFRCASCGEIVSATFSSYAEEDDESVRELEATEKCFACGYTPFRVREVLAQQVSRISLVEWPE